MIDNPLNRLSVKRGEALPQAKLKTQDVRLIKDLIAERDYLKRQLAQLSNRAIAQKFDVSQRCIDAISEGRTWLHVE